MKFDATADEIRALLRYVELNSADHPAGSPRTQEAARRGVSRPLLERYSTLRERGRSPEVVAIDRGACSGCHVRLPTMLEHQVRRALAVYTCPHCRRLLYSSELLGADTAPAAKPQRHEAARSERTRA